LQKAAAAICDGQADQPLRARKACSALVEIPVWLSRHAVQTAPVLTGCSKLHRWPPPHPGPSDVAPRSPIPAERGCCWVTPRPPTFRATGLSPCASTQFILLLLFLFPPFLRIPQASQVQLLRPSYILPGRGGCFLLLVPLSVCLLFLFLSPSRIPLSGLGSPCAASVPPVVQNQFRPPQAAPARPNCCRQQTRPVPDAAIETN
jgi:hypothetical protein